MYLKSFVYFTIAKKYYSKNYYQKISRRKKNITVFKNDFR